MLFFYAEVLERAVFSKEERRMKPYLKQQLDFDSEFVGLYVHWKLNPSFTLSPLQQHSERAQLAYWNSLLLLHKMLERQEVAALECLT